MVQTAAWALAALLHLAPFLAASEARAVDLAVAVAGASPRREDQALLVAVAWLETGRTFDLGLVGDHGHSVSPWQLWTAPGSARQRQLARDLGEAAREALARASASIRACRALLPGDRLAQYTTGRCRPNREARQRWALRARLLREVPAVDEAPGAVAPSPADGQREDGMESSRVSILDGAMTNVVVDDPAGEFWEGSLVGKEVAAQVLSRGGATLPVDAGLFRLSGVGGYFRRAWGAGWPIDHMSPQRFCPMALWLPSTHRVLNWVARLAPDARALAALREGRPLDGQIQVSSEPGRSSGHKAGLSPEKLPVLGKELGPLDERGGWTVGGRARIGLQADAVYEFALYGWLPGARVVWAACSATI